MEKRILMIKLKKKLIELQVCIKRSTLNWTFLEFLLGAGMWQLFIFSCLFRRLIWSMSYCFDFDLIFLKLTIKLKKPRQLHEKNWDEREKGEKDFFININYK